MDARASTPPVLFGDMARVLLILFGLSLAVRAATAWTLPHPGYFDAFYYYHLAQNMAEGRGLTENLVWNYLDDPAMIPRPGAQYWMPLAAFVAWLGIVTLPFLDSWRAAQAPFVLASALLPPLSAWISWQARGKREWAIVSGLLTLFSGFYFVYWVVPDNFLPFALAAALCFVGLGKAIDHEVGGSRLSYWFLAGLGAGLSHLSRIDGALMVLLIAAFWAFRRERAWREAMATALGYLVVIAPWFARNYLVAGTILPGGGLQTLWLTHYDELFAYEAVLTPSRYLEWGVINILESKAQSLWHCLLVILGATQFFMAPFVITAIPKALTLPLFRPALWYAALLLTVMPLLFTFPAMHGSLLHSAAALVPWFMAMVPYGLARIVSAIAARRRTWNATQATRVFGAGFVLLAAGVTFGMAATALWLPAAPGAVLARWRDRTVPYAAVGAWLSSNSQPDALIFVDQPPVFTVVTGRPSLVIPSDGIDALTHAAEEWDAAFLLLDYDYAEKYPTMWPEPEPAGPWEPVTTFTDGVDRPVLLYRYAP